MKSNDLIVSGRKLLAGQPTEADCRRAVSTAYYALFYQLCEMASRSLTGVIDHQLSRARYQVFRSLTHGNAYERCGATKTIGLDFPQAVQNFAVTFIELKEERELADYCPECSYSQKTAEEYLNQAESALADLNSIGEEHKRAFSIYILLSKNKFSKRTKVVPREKIGETGTEQSKQ
jgi:hypothetical protein